jgi:hypothetical protein
VERFAPEDKFVAPAARKCEALALLDHFCAPDPSFHRGFVNSIYYDTPWLDAYWEKANGDFLKTKLRLRWYDPDVAPDPVRCTAFLEVKRKVGSGRRKARCKLNVDRSLVEQAPLTDPDFMNIIRKSEPDLSEWLPVGCVPVVAIRYERVRYICPVTGARVALDMDIHATRSNPAIIPERARASLGWTVLEVKGQERMELPWIRHLNSIGFRASSFSKFGMCMSEIMQED